jgi:hypothetical protein
VNNFEPEKENGSEGIDEIKQYIKSFQAKIAQRFPYEEEESKRVNNEEIENIIMRAIYEKAYELVVDTPRDEDMDYRMRLFDFITFEHLEIDFSMINDENLEKIKAQIVKINTFKTPKDKLVGIINCCKLVSGMIKVDQKEEAKRDVGADDFLPVLIFCVLKAQPKCPISDIRYIKLF